MLRSRASELPRPLSGRYITGGISLVEVLRVPGMTDDIYTLRITAHTPDTIPLAQLAEYMGGLAALLGEKNHVHFKALERGSTRLVSRVEQGAASTVRERLAGAMSGHLPDAALAFNQLNRVLYQDGAEAELTCHDVPVLFFPGCKTIFPPKLGPFTQAAERDGILIRVGGKDKSAHATIEDAEGNTWNFEVSRELAKELAQHLFGAPLRLHGKGRFTRDEDGTWQCRDLKATEFSILDDSPLDVVLERIWNLPNDTWNRDMDAMQVLASLRHN